MSTASYEYELELDTLFGDQTDDKNLSVEVDVRLTAHSVRPSGTWGGPPEHYDPGSDAEFEIDEIRVTGGTTEKPVRMTFTPQQFEAFFPGGESILLQAIEQANENEVDFIDEY